MENAKECYGMMYPSVLDLKSGKSSLGHVFEYQIERTGWMTGERAVTADLRKWAECIQCSDFAHCRHLSTGKLLLEIGVGHSGILP